ncbi:energy-coupling factor ABC transporter permease [Stenoxybacter acetivorans]|uniref:energy-coupling factor ABC transporter permease n=1 Tax=Stenoxybacter acetivorans TaxID=422441 RepID=UPI00055E3153|nr:energy-coupling factor ABC transporter permease [Stenoxybacter acetivorans]
MNFYSHWFNPPVLWAANGVCLILMFITFPAACRIIRTHHAAVVSATLMLALFWGLRANITDGHLAGMSYHLMGVALAALMLGAAGALWLCGMLMLAACVIFGGIDNLTAWGINLICCIIPPVFISTLLLRFAQKRLPENVFVYIFVNGFLAAIIGMAFIALCVGISLYSAQVFNTETLLQQVLPLFILIAWGDAFLTGLFSAVFIAFAPQFLSTFNDEHYLKRQTDW